MPEDRRSTFEKVLGPSWEASIAGYASGGLGLILVMLGLAFDSKETLGLGIATLSGGMIALGKVARTESQHARDKEEGKT